MKENERVQLYNLQIFKLFLTPAVTVRCSQTAGFLLHRVYLDLHRNTLNLVQNTTITTQIIQ